MKHHGHARISQQELIYRIPYYCLFIVFNDNIIIYIDNNQIVIIMRNML